MRGRTRGSMAVSGVLHALLFAWLVFRPVAAPAGSPITEIAYLETDDVPGSGGDTIAGGAPAAVTSAATPPARGGSGDGTWWPISDSHAGTRRARSRSVRATMRHSRIGSRPA